MAINKIDKDTTAQQLVNEWTTKENPGIPTPTTPANSQKIRELIKEGEAIDQECSLRDIPKEERLRMRPGARRANRAVSTAFQELLTDFPEVEKGSVPVTLFRFLDKVGDGLASYVEGCGQALLSLEQGCIDTSAQLRKVNQDTTKLLDENDGEAKVPSLAPNQLRIVLGKTHAEIVAMEQAPQNKSKRSASQVEKAQAKLADKRAELHLTKQVQKLKQDAQAGLLPPKRSRRPKED